MDRARHEGDTGALEAERSPSRGGRPAPLHEVFDEGEYLRTIIDIPGVVGDDIRFEVHGLDLTVYARQRDGRCVRRVRLPAPVCAERATSSYRNGMFEITLPKEGRDGHR
jgi:HSP20 family molecular chaperone IbpA